MRDEAPVIARGCNGRKKKGRNGRSDGSLAGNPDGKGLSAAAIRPGPFTAASSVSHLPLHVHAQCPAGSPALCARSLVAREGLGRRLLLHCVPSGLKAVHLQTAD